MYATLESIKGKTYLWEKWPAEANTFRTGNRHHDEFSVKTLRWAISAIFAEYNRQNPTMRVKPHDLRRRAITLTAMTTQSVDATAQAIGIDPQTARRYYLDAQAAFDGQEIMKRMADVLKLKGKKAS